MNLKLFQVACCCFPHDFSGRQRTWCMLSRGLRTAHASLTANHRAIGSIRALSVMSRSPSPPHKRVKVDVAVEQAPVQALTMPVPVTDTTPAAAGPSNANAPLKTKSRKHKNKKPPMPDPCSPDDVLYNDIRDFLGPERVDAAYTALDGREWNVPENIVQGEIIELTVGAFTVSGDSLSRVSPANKGEDEPLWAIVTPFAHPGDLIKARVYRSSRLHSYADLIQVVEANMEYRGGEGDRENGGTKGCKYFGVWCVALVRRLSLLTGQSVEAASSKLCRIPSNFCTRPRLSHSPTSASRLFPPLQSPRSFLRLDHQSSGRIGPRSRRTLMRSRSD